MNSLPVDYLQECFDLLDDGTLVWKLRPENHFSSNHGLNIHKKRFAGKEAGCLSGRGYIYVNIDQKMYKAHRIVWAMTYGEWPSGHLDHINGIRTDNRPSNLRLATAEQNGYNRKSKLGKLRGVFKSSSRINPFKAEIRANGSRHHLGVFKTEEEAHAAYAQASMSMHGEYGRVS